MDSVKAKFCLSTIEEYYFEESVDRFDEDDDYSSIFRLFHQRALNRSKKAEIQNKVQGVFSQQACLDYAQDDSSVYSTPDSSNLKLNSTSFNQRKYDLVHNQVN